MAMLEKQRLTYLEALGIDSYIPQRLLPSAAPSHLLSAEYFSTDSLSEGASVIHADVAPSLPNVDKDDFTSNQNGVKSLSEALDVLNLSDVSKPVADHSASGPVDPPGRVNTDVPEQNHNGSNTVAPVPSAQIKFSLNVWRVKDDILVIDSRQPGAALPTDRLLQNILRAVGYPMAQLPNSELLRWPLFKDDTSAQSEDEARAMVQAYISAQCTKSTVKAILLLGKDAVRFSLSIDGEIEAYFDQHQGTSILQPQWNTSALIAPSLIEMLQEPVQKATTWQALQYFCVQQ